MCWIITATATLGDEAGAKLTNQAYGGTSEPSGLVRPLSAVPVLPATWTPGIAAYLAVPFRTVATINLVTRAALVDETAWWSSFSPGPGANRCWDGDCSSSVR